MGSNAHMFISKEAFKSLPEDEQHYTIYLNMINQGQRIYALEHRKLIDKGKSFVGGILGGALTMLGIKWGGL